MLSESKMEGETDPAGKSGVSCAFDNTVGLWVPGLISLAVRMRTTGPGLAVGVKEPKKKKNLNELKSKIKKKSSCFNFTKSIPLALF